MLGNDIIDLSKAKFQSNWRRKGYLDKIFNPEEQGQLFKSGNPDQFVWLLWSMKEAVYKIINRANLIRSFNPLKFSCQEILLGNGINGRVKYEEETCFTMSLITENFIHTIASSKEDNLTTIHAYYFANSENYVSDFNAKSANFYLEKNVDGIPSLVHKRNGEQHIASISHHGDYLAIIYSNKLRL
jgi:phosphopantetheinyl transferase (holo-ACP synthase)